MSVGETVDIVRSTGGGGLCSTYSYGVGQGVLVLVLTVTMITKQVGLCSVTLTVPTRAVEAMNQS